MGQRERKVEECLKKRVERLNGECLKWTSPGNSGVPDRLCIIPGEEIFGVEVKTYDGRLSSVQERMIERLDLAGMMVHVVYGQEDVHALMDSYE